MRKAPGPAPAATPQYPVGAQPRSKLQLAKKIATSKAGGATLVVLAILFWYIFYQNLPANFGLNQVGPFVPVDEGAASGQDRFFKILMLAISAMVIATKWSLVRSMLKSMNVGFLIFLVLIPASAAWSFDRNATLLRFVSLMSIVMVCFAISIAGWNRHRFQQVTIPPLMYILLLSLVVGAMYPDRIVERGNDLSQRDAWHGITITKNQFGMAASFGLIIFVNRWLAREGRMAWAVVGAAVSMLCLILSRSNTSLLAGMIGVTFMTMVMRVPIIRQRYSVHLIIALASLLILYEMVIQDLVPGAHTLMGPIRAWTGKDASLSGRTIIWDIVKEHMRTAPLLGTGYGAYWLGDQPSSPAYVFVYRMFFYPSESHNGYLEIMNDMGYVGLVCLLVFIVTYLRQGIELMRRDRGQAAMYLALLYHQLVVNMSESEWFARDSVFTMMILSVVCMSRALHESRQQVNVHAYVPVQPPQARSTELWARGRRG